MKKARTRMDNLRKSPEDNLLIPMFLTSVKPSQSQSLKPSQAITTSRAARSQALHAFLSTKKSEITPPSLMGPQLEAIPLLDLVICMAHIQVVEDCLSDFVVVCCVHLNFTMAV